MIIDIKMNYLNEPLTLMQMSLCVDKQISFQGQFEWIDIFLKSLIPTILSNKNKEAIYYMPNEEEAILLKIDSSSISFSICDERAVIAELEKLEADWYDLRQIPTHLTDKMPAFSQFHLPYDEGILIFLCIAEKYIIDWITYNKVTDIQEINSMRDFISYFESVKQQLFLLTKDVTSSLRITVCSSIYANRIKSVDIGCIEYATGIGLVKRS